MAGSGTVVTYAELEEGSRRLARVWEAAGLGFGDHVAFLIENQARFFEVSWAAQRSGLYYTCISSKLTAGEVIRIFAPQSPTMYSTSPGVGPVVDELPGVLKGVKPVSYTHLTLPTILLV